MAKKRSTVEGVSEVAAATVNAQSGFGGVVAGSDGRRKRPSRLRMFVIFSILVVAVVTGAWHYNAYRQHRDYYAPAKQAQLYEAAAMKADDYRTQRQYTGEVQVYEDYLAKKPLDKYRNKATLNLAGALVRARRYDDAIRRYQSVENIPEHKLDALRGLSQAYSGKQDNTKAVEYLQRSISTSSTDDNAEPKIQGEETMVEGAQQQ